MALTAGNSALATDFNSLRDRVVAEMARRRRTTFSPAGSTFPSVTAGNKTQATEVNYLINALNTINSTTTNFNAVDVGTLMSAIA